MFDRIHYNYGANYAGLDDIQGATNDAQAMRDEINQVFMALSGVYEGEAAAALHQRHIQISQAMEAVLYEIAQARQAGNQSQEDAATLDARLAAGLGGAGSGLGLGGSGSVLA